MIQYDAQPRPTPRPSHAVPTARPSPATAAAREETARSSAWGVSAIAAMFSRGPPAGRRRRTAGRRRCEPGPAVSGIIAVVVSFDGESGARWSYDPDARVGDKGGFGQVFRGTG